MVTASVSPSHRVRTPTILQMEAVECGAAALAIVLGYYRRFVPLPELRLACGVSRDGVKASKVVKAARLYGMEATGLRLELEELRSLTPPYIVFWQFNHFLVVEGFSQNRVYLSDPALGRRQVSLAEFDAGFTGVVLEIRPGANFRPAGVPFRVLPGIAQRLRGSVDSIIATFLAGLYQALPKLALTVSSGIFIDQVLVQQRWDWLRPLTLIMAIAALLSVLLKEIQLRYLRHLQIKLSTQMSGQFLWHVLRLPMRFYAQRFAGEIGNRISLNDKVADTLSGDLATAAIGLATMGIYGLVMLTYNAGLTAIATGFALINVVALQQISRQRVDANMRLVQDYGKVMGVTIEGLQNIESLKASGQENDFFSRWAGYYARACRSQQELGLQSQILGLLPAFLTSLSGVFILVLGGLAVMAGQLSLGGFVAFQLLVIQFLTPVNSLVSLGQKLQELSGDIGRLDDVLVNDLDQEVLQTENELSTTVPVDLRGEIELRNLTFAHNLLDPPLIENFNLAIAPGQRVALVGASGSGKSTVARLIAGLYQPTGGEIYLDGYRRSQIPRPLLTRTIAMVEQEVLLFSGTVRENLTLWDSTITDQQLVQACKDAAIHETVVMLPRGYDAELQEAGMNLSGGQRQRLEIARALVRNPAILILDEATSALDVETERQIVRNLRRRGCTCLLVAHRLSTIRDCDQIIVMWEGKIVQRGTHNQLWQEGGKYAHLVKAEEG